MARELDAKDLSTAVERGGGMGIKQRDQQMTRELVARYLNTVLEWGGRGSKPRDQHVLLIPG